MTPWQLRHTHPEWIIIKQHVNPPSGTITYQWDGRRFPSHDQAMRAGWRTFWSNFYNIGQIDQGQLVWFGHMNTEIPGLDLPGIAREIGLTPATTEAAQ